MSRYHIRFFLFLFLAVLFHVEAQVQASTRIRSIHQEYVDSLKHVRYVHVFPIWGQKAYEQGIDLPYPFGIMGNYVWMKQGVVINNMRLGFKNENPDIPLPNTDFIRFGDNRNTSYSAKSGQDQIVSDYYN